MTDEFAEIEMTQVKGFQVGLSETLNRARYHSPGMTLVPTDVIDLLYRIAYGREDDDFKQAMDDYLSHKEASNV